MITLEQSSLKIIKNILKITKAQIKLKKMQTSQQQHQLYLQQLQIQLIPNLHNLDPQVQEEVMKVLNAIIEPQCCRTKLSIISRMNLLDQTPLLRAHVWKILLGTMDMAWHKWQETRVKNEELYTALRDQFCPKQISDQNGVNDQQNYDFDQQLWNQIALDTKRTHSTINFFQTQIFFTKVYHNRPTKHSDVLSRILYIWSKTNSSVRYVQGMNQIVAPLYYLQFQWMNIIHWDRQSQVFSMFSAIMSYIIDMHIKEMDDCQTGILGRMMFLSRYLKVVDEELWNKMQKQGIYPESYSFRWLALLLAQEFGIYDTIRLWDYVLSYDEENRYFFVYSLCISILQLRRKIILNNDFTTSLPLIQKLKDMDVEEVLDIGTQLFDKYRWVKINQEFQKKVAKDKINSKQMVGMAESIHLARGSWSYADILKHATNYLSKINYFGKQKQ